MGLHSNHHYYEYNKNIPILVIGHQSPNCRNRRNLNIWKSPILVDSLAGCFRIATRYSSGRLRGSTGGKIVNEQTQAWLLS
jgi:hypothetical protein